MLSNSNQKKRENRLLYKYSRVCFFLLLLLFFHAFSSFIIVTLPEKIGNYEFVEQPSYPISADSPLTIVNNADYPITLELRKPEGLYKSSIPDNHYTNIDDLVAALDGFSYSGDVSITSSMTWGHKRFFNLNRASGVTPSIIYVFPETTGSHVEFYIASHDTQGNAMSIKVSSMHPYSHIIYLRYYDRALDYYDGSSYIEICPLADDTFHHIRIDIAFPSQTLDIYVDGTLVLSGIPFWHSANSFGSISFSDYYGTGGFYVDAIDLSNDASYHVGRNTELEYDQALWDGCTKSATYNIDANSKYYTMRADELYLFRIYDRFSYVLREGILAPTEDTIEYTDTLDSTVIQNHADDLINISYYVSANFNGYDSFDGPILFESYDPYNYEWGITYSIENTHGHDSSIIWTGVLSYNISIDMNGMIDFWAYGAREGSNVRVRLFMDSLVLWEEVVLYPSFHKWDYFQLLLRSQKIYIYRNCELYNIQTSVYPSAGYEYITFKSESSSQIYLDAVDFYNQTDYVIGRGYVPVQSSENSTMILPPYTSETMSPSGYMVYTISDRNGNVLKTGMAAPGDTVNYIPDRSVLCNFQILDMFGRPIIDRASLSLYINGSIMSGSTAYLSPDTNVNLTMVDPFGEILYQGLYEINSSNNLITVNLEMSSLKIQSSLSLSTSITLNRSGTTGTYSLYILPGEIWDIWLHPANYSLEYILENGTIDNILIDMSCSKVVVLNSSYSMIYFAAFDETGLGVDTSQFRLYINGERHSWGTILCPPIVNILVLDYFGISLYNETLYVGAFTDFNIYLPVYTLLINNNYTESMRVKIYRDSKPDYALTNVIPAQSAISYRFLANITYSIEIYYTNGTLADAKQVVLDRNNKILSFGYYSKPITNIEISGVTPADLIIILSIALTSTSLFAYSLKKIRAQDIQIEKRRRVTVNPSRTTNPIAHIRGE